MARFRRSGQISETASPIKPASTNQLLASACMAVVESLEERRLFAYPNTTQPLPYYLDFSSDRGGILDKDGQGTGFTRIQENKNGNEYLASLIDLDTTSGVLKIRTSGNAAAGGNYNGDNTLTNALESQFDATTIGFTITTRLVGPLSYINNPSEQAGIMFGPDQDNYVKLVAVAQPGGTYIQFIDEQTSGSTYSHALAGNNINNTYTNIGDFSAVQTLDLRMVGDAETGKVSAYYSVNGGTFVKIAAELTLTGSKKTAFFSSAGRAGLIAMHKNDISAETMVFDKFEITPGTPIGAQPTVTGSRPGNGEINVRRDSFIAADVYLPTPGAGVDSNTLSSATVKLYRTSDGVSVAATVNTTGGGDAIVLTPMSILDANTSYTFEITSGVKDTSGHAFAPYKITFTTGTAGGEIDQSVAFEKVALSTATGHKYTVLKIGPDGKLYAGTEKGLIQRFDINADGTLGTPTNITTIKNNNGGADRLLVGMAFDPASTASNPILWVSHSQGVLENAQDWTGKIARLSGANLGTYQDAVVNLPRSIRDHVTNQMAFGPDGKLYFSQGAMSAMGAPDNAWGLRAEHLLSAAILQLDTTKVLASALDAKTEDGGTYNPFATNAPLKIYAMGIRNSYDLVWHSNGKLYTATNGSAAGGNTPGGNGVPALNNVVTQPDLLFALQQGKYYGHPNPTLNNYVLNGGNPTSGVDPLEVAQYPVGTQVPANYGGIAYNFGKNYSPNGMIEYKGSAFNNSLNGALMVVRYSGGDDILIMKLDANGNVIETKSNVAGMNGFVDPLDLEQTDNGNIYVSEYGADRITLIRPIAPGANIAADKPKVYFNDTISSGASGAQTVKITNTGTGPLTLSAINLGGTDASRFTITNKPAGSVTLQAGQSLSLSITFTASNTRIYDAKLVITSNDSDTPSFEVGLRGLGTAGTGGINEPSLQRILDLYQIPINVGDSNPNDVYLDNPPVSPNDEVVVQRLLKAGSGDVTIEPLAIFGVGSGTYTTLELGYYKPGSQFDKTKLFSVQGNNSAQSVNPNISGVTSFDPGSAAFGLYGLWPSMQTISPTAFPQGTQTFSEDALNLPMDSASPRKFRFYQLTNSSGAVVPNAYVVAVEEFNAGYDQQDAVFIIRNVKAAPAGPEIGLENLDGTQYSDRLIFSRTSVKNTMFPNGFHDTATVRIRNTGSSALTISNLSITSSWVLVGAPSTPFTVAANGGFVDITVRFQATSGTLQTGQLTITSNDADEPTTAVTLMGWRQANSENPEPSLQQMFDIFGYTTVVEHAGQQLNNGGKVERIGDEILSAYWKRASADMPTTVTQLAAYHGQGDLATIRYLSKGSASNSSGTALFTHENLDGQTFLPRIEGTNQLARASFSSNGTFMFRVDGFKEATPNVLLKEWSDPTYNNQEQPGGGYGHHVRFFVAKDRGGKIIPNTYLMVVDYAAINYDYQDNVYLIENVKPESGPSTPTNPTASFVGNGINIDWSNNTEANLAGYNVYRSDSEGGTYTKINSSLITTSDLLDTGAPLNATSYYRISAVDVHGNESGFATTSAFRGNDTTAPAAPAGLVSTPSATGIALDWANNGEIDLAGYNVYRASSLNGVYVKLNTAGLLSNSDYSDTGAPQGATSYYRVTAVDFSGNESTAAVTNATRPAADTTPPAAPKSLVSTGSSAGISLDWANNTESDLAGYNVYRSNSEFGTYSKLNTAALLTLSDYNDTAAPVGVTSYYRVTAVDTSGNESLAATTNMLRPGTPSGDVVLRASADTYVRGGSYTGQNFGLDGSITVKDSSSSNTREGYLTFDINSLTNVSNVKLRLFGYVADTNSTQSIKVHGVTDTSWNEDQITFSTKPAAGSQIGAISVNAIYSTNAKWFELDVTSYVQAALASGKSQVSFALLGSGGRVEFNSDEATGNRPELAVTAGTTPGDTTPPATPTGVTSSGSTSGIAVDWNDNSESDLAGYNVYRASTAGGPYTKLNGSPLSTSAFNDTSAPTGVTSHYRITAVDTTGNESAFASTSAVRPNQSTGTVTLRAAQDAFVRSGSYAGQNYGSSSTLTVKSSSSSNNTRETYLTFNLSTLSNVSDVKLRLFGYVADTNTSQTISLHSVSNTSWTESGLTYNNRPSAGSQLGSVVVNGIYSDNAAWYEFDVTSYVQAALAASQASVSFVLTGSDGRVEFNSDEASTNRPELVASSNVGSSDTTPPSAPTAPTATGSTSGVSVDWANNTESDLAGYNVYRSSSASGTYAKLNSSLLTSSDYNDTSAPAGATSYYRISAVDLSGNESAFAPTSAMRPEVPSGTTMLRATNDAFVRSGSYASQNYGMSDTLTVKSSSSSNNTRESYLTFDIASLSTISNVKLRLYGYVADTTSTQSIDLYAVNNTGWSETGITYNNRPTSASQLGNVVVTGIYSDNAAWYEFNVTAYVQSARSAGQSSVSFVLKGGDGRVEFNSDEAIANRPELVVQG